MDEDQVLLFLTEKCFNNYPEISVSSDKHFQLAELSSSIGESQKCMNLENLILIFVENETNWKLSSATYLSSLSFRRESPGRSTPEHIGYLWVSPDIHNPKSQRWVFGSISDLCQIHIPDFHGPWAFVELQNRDFRDLSKKGLTEFSKNLKFLGFRISWHSLSLSLFAPPPIQDVLSVLSSMSFKLENTHKRRLFLLFYK